METEDIAWNIQSAVGEPITSLCAPSFFVEMLAHTQQYGCSKATRELDYPRNPVEAALRDALAWFKGERVSVSAQEHGRCPRAVGD